METWLIAAGAYMLGLATPYLKLLAQQIVVGAYKKAKAEIRRWFK